jgi:hypothetical protein
MKNENINKVHNIMSRMECRKKNRVDRNNEEEEYK